MPGGQTKKAKSRNFCFTMNNYAATDLETLQSISWIKYGCVGREVGESGTPHLQGYIQCDRKTRTTDSGLSKKLNKAGTSHAHVEVARGTPEEAALYCQKDGDYVEWGTISKGKGARRDIHAFHADAKKVRSERDELALSDAHPAAYHKYWKSAKRVADLSKDVEALDERDARMSEVTLRDWQQRVREIVLRQDNRKVCWLVDLPGGQGKSVLAEYMAANDNAFLVTSGKSADIAKAYNREPVVIFDFTRAKEETVNYAVMEGFKNGRLFSPKYESKQMIFAPAKVLVCANWAPRYEELSADRWNVIDLADFQETPFTKAKSGKRKRSAMEVDDWEMEDEAPYDAKRARTSKYDEDFTFK